MIIAVVLSVLVCSLVQVVHSKLVGLPLSSSASLSLVSEVLQQLRCAC
jgi:hypothetical protein